eukprot:COSAG02_NODE_5029_length_4717_cov_3.581854_4_plen_256_part_00
MGWAGVRRATLAKGAEVTHRDPLAQHIPEAAICGVGPAVVIDDLVDCRRGLGVRCPRTCRDCQQHKQADGDGGRPEHSAALISTERERPPRARRRGGDWRDCQARPGLCSRISGWVSGVGGSPIFACYKSVFICSVYSILGSQIDRDPDPGSSEKSENHEGFCVSTLLIHPLDRSESMQELILIRGELSARAGRSELNSPDSTDCKSVFIWSLDLGTGSRISDPAMKLEGTSENSDHVAKLANECYKLGQWNRAK